jgi:hypothetical protein
MAIEHLADIEIEILKLIQHVGWYGQLWFPRVFRDALDFQEGPTDEEIHAALLVLISSRLLEVWRLEGGCPVERCAPTDDLLVEIRKNSAETDFELRINQEVLAELDLRERPRLGGLR